MDSRQKQILEYRSYPNGYYHLCTDGWSGGNLFNTIGQFAFGMCTIALLTLKFGVKIISFELMPNHIHIAICGTGEQCLDSFFFIMERIRKRLKEDGNLVPPDSYWFKLVPVENRSALKDLIVYLARNKYEKGECTPVGHLWGTGYLVYNQFADFIRGTKVKDMKVRDIEKIVGSRIKLPSDWEIHPQLGILPASFVRTDKVLDLFPTVKDYMAALVKEYEADVKISKTVGESVTWSFQEAKDITLRQLNDDYPGFSADKLTTEQKGELAVKVNAHYDITPYHLARVLGVQEYVIKQFLNSKDYGRRKKPGI